jgi:hypothetical protein
VTCLCKEKAENGWALQTFSEKAKGYRAAHFLEFSSNAKAIPGFIL